MKILFDFLDRVMYIGAIFNMFILLGVVLLQVFARVALPQVPAWTEEASRLFFMWAVAFAAGPAVREQAYVDVDSFTIHLPQKIQLWLAIIMDVILVGFCGVITYESTKLVVSVEGQTSAALIWPMWVFYLSVWLQSLMLTLYLARSVVRMIKTGSIKNEEHGVKGGEAI